MALFRCKMCGGTLEIEQGISVATCEYCGTQQTLPRLDDERKANLYDRANHFRRNNEYDKASGIYEQILIEDSSDAESYWSLVLCRYGIEYVEDPVSHKRIPTVNRAQFTSIFDDDNYKSALRYADDHQKAIYEEEAKTINEIQRGILAISQKEKPFDVFICYKETDNNGRRTPDSVLANDLYHQLTQEGFKVFFSRITLEDKLGVEYEPYIFAALNSSQVMVVMGTRPEYFNAPWVRNEWSRFLILIKNGEPKTLIPAYRDMNPYDLPEEFSQLQALDMSRLGFMQDLIRGIKKITGAKVAVVPIPQEVPQVVSPLLRRAFLFLEDGDWQSANEYCEKVLDQEPENGKAYLGLLMIALKVCRESDLEKQEQPFDDHPLYKKAVRFGDAALIAELTGYNQSIRNRIEFARLEAERLERERQEELRRKAEEERLRKEEEERKREEARLQVQQERERKRAEAKMRRQAELLAIQIQREKAAEAKRLRKQEQEQKKEQAAAEKRKRAEEAKQKKLAERAARKEKQTSSKKKPLIAFAVVLLIGGAAFGGIKWKQETDYTTAVQLMQEERFEEAVVASTEPGEFKPSASLLTLAESSQQYNAAVAAMEKIVVGSWSQSDSTYVFDQDGSYTLLYHGTKLKSGSYRIAGDVGSYVLCVDNNTYGWDLEFVSYNEITVNNVRYFRNNDDNTTTADVNAENHQTETVTEAESKLQEYQDKLVGSWAIGSSTGSPHFVFHSDGTFVKQYDTTIKLDTYQVKWSGKRYYLHTTEWNPTLLEFVSDDEIVLSGTGHYFRINDDTTTTADENAENHQAETITEAESKLQKYQDKLVGTWIKDALFMTFYADGSVIEKTNREILREGTYQIVPSGKTYNLEMAFANGSSDVWTIAFVSSNEFERLYKNYYGRDEWHSYRRIRE